MFSKYVDEYRYKACDEIFSENKFNNDLLNYAVDEVINNEFIENLYSKSSTIEVSRVYSIYDYIRNKYEYFFKDTKNMFIFLSAIFIMFMVIIVSILTNSSKKRNNFQFK